MLFNSTFENTKKHCHFLKYCISILLDFFLYCNTAILHFWKVMQYYQNSEKVLKYWNAILQYCNTESLFKLLISRPKWTAMSYINNILTTDHGPQGRPFLKWERWFLRPWLNDLIIIDNCSRDLWKEWTHRLNRTSALKSLKWEPFGGVLFCHY